MSTIELITAEKGFAILSALKPIPSAPQHCLFWPPLCVPLLRSEIITGPHL